MQKLTKRDKTDLCYAKVISDTITLDGETFTIYGLKITIGTDFSESYRNITDNYEKIQKFCRSLHGKKISVLHIEDIIQDFCDCLHFHC